MEKENNVSESDGVVEPTPETNPEDEAASEVKAVDFRAEVKAEAAKVAEEVKKEDDGLLHIVPEINIPDFNVDIPEFSAF